MGPKTKRSVRTVDLAPQLASAFREARPHVPAETLRTQLVFSNRNGKPHDPDTLVRRQFIPALERAELPRIDDPLHLREAQIRDAFDRSAEELGLLASLSTGRRPPAPRGPRQPSEPRL